VLAQAPGKLQRPLALLERVAGLELGADDGTDEQGS
jgi:hypothetical protein